MDLTIAYQRWVITLRTPNTMRKYRECVGKFSRDTFGKEPWELTLEELQRVTRLDVRERFYLPMVRKGRSQTTIQGYFTPVRSYLNYINEHHVFYEPINTEKFQWTGQVLPSKRQLINRVERLEKELEDLKNILDTYDYDRREIEA